MSPRETDALIAEKVFGAMVQWLPTSLQPRVPHYQNSEIGSGWLVLPSYSSDIAAAFLVVEKMRELGHDIEIVSVEDGKWRCCFTSYHIPNPLANGGCGDAGESEYWDESQLLTGAICLAALKALGVEVPQ